MFLVDLDGQPFKTEVLLQLVDAMLTDFSLCYFSNLLNLGTANAARIPSNAIATINSIKVNPSDLLSSFITFSGRG